MESSINKKRKRLESISKMKLEIRTLEEEIRLLREEAASLSRPSYESGIAIKERKNSAGFEKAVDRIVDMEKENLRRIEILNNEIERIRKSIDILGYEEKTVLIMHYILGKTHRQIAGELYCSDRTVARLILKALEDLEI